jgi:hypothetical protein
MVRRLGRRRRRNHGGPAANSADSGRHPIDLGGPTCSRRQPADARPERRELDRVIAGMLTIGGSDSGEMRITSPHRYTPAATNMHLVSGGAIVFDPGSIDTGGGTLSAVRAVTCNR